MSLLILHSWTTKYNTTLNWWASKPIPEFFFVSWDEEVKLSLFAPLFLSWFIWDNFLNILSSHTLLSRHFFNISWSILINTLYAFQKKTPQVRCNWLHWYILEWSTPLHKMNYDLKHHESTWYIWFIMILDFLRYWNEWRMGLWEFPHQVFA